MHAPNAAAGTLVPRTLGFFLLTLGFTWMMQAPATLAKLGAIPGGPQLYGGLTGLGMFGPLLASTSLTWLESRRHGLRALYGQLLQWRAHLYWYLGSLFGPPLLLAAGLFLLDPSGARPCFYPPDHAARVVALLLVPVVEEIGWRGYALPRLLRRYSPLVASLIVGAFWWAWHCAMFVLQDFTAEHFLLALLLLLAGSVVYTWLYLRSGGGLSVAVLVHASAHLSNSNIALPADTVPFVVQTAEFCLAALILVLVERKALRPRPTVA